MFFTQEDYKKIESWLYQRTVKDTDFPTAFPLKGNESVPIIQDSKNRVIGFNDLVKQVALKRPADFYNVSASFCKFSLTLEEAINLVPENQRKLGLSITFRNKNGNWMLYQFTGTSINQWDTPYLWKSFIESALDELVFWPDEEDITFVQDGNRKLLKFRNREFSPEEFIGMGMVILRRNYEGTEACAIDDEDYLLNVLTQDMISSPNTVYVIEYDFDLNGKTITIPNNCVLWFQGGTINNGSIYLKETAILGAFEFADMGNCKLQGTFNTGQVMTFRNDSYLKKEGNYFYNSTLVEKTETFTPGEVNSHVYSATQRQELRWWNGEEWVLILDATDYSELKSIIDNLIDKHNKEVSQIFQYFKNRCTQLETRMTNVETRVTNTEIRLDNHDTTLNNHETRITNVENRATNLENRATTIENNLTAETNRAKKREDEIAEQLRTFLQDTDTKDKTINKWKEIQNFLDGITDTETLLGLLEEVSKKAKDASDKVAQDLANEIQNRINGDNALRESITTNTTDINNIKSTVNTLQQTINSIDGKITSAIEAYVSSHILGAKSVTVGTTKYDMDPATGNITIPAYPEVSGDTGGGGTADKVAHKLKFTGAVNEEYDGSKEVNVNIPISDFDRYPAKYNISSNLSKAVSAEIRCLADVIIRGATTRKVLNSEDGVVLYELSMVNTKTLEVNPVPSSQQTGWIASDSFYSESPIDKVHVYLYEDVSNKIYWVAVALEGNGVIGLSDISITWDNRIDDMLEEFPKLFNLSNSEETTIPIYAICGVNTNQMDNKFKSVDINSYIDYPILKIKNPNDVANSTGSPGNIYYFGWWCMEASSGTLKKLSKRPHNIRIKFIGNGK